MKLNYESDHIFHYLKEAPAPIKDVLKTLDSNLEKIVALYVATTLSGSLMPNVTVNYKNKENYPSLYLAIIMPPGRGKGLVSDVAEIISSVNADLMNVSNLKQKEYNEKMKHIGKKGKNATTITPEPEKPKFVILRISGDITSSRFKEQLAENDGVEFLALIETEMDSFGINSSGSLFGTNNSIILRNAYEFEAISQMRRLNSEYLMCETPKLSVVLSGTESQLANVFPNNKDGLLSRFLILLDNTPAEWQNVKPNNNRPPLKKYFRGLAPLFKRVWLAQKRGKIEVALTDSQWEKLNNYGRRKLNSVQEERDENAESIPKRHTNMVVRIASIFSVLRNFENLPASGKIVCLDCDFHLAMLMVDLSFNFALTLYDSLSRKSDFKNADLSGLIGKMYDIFTTEEFIQECLNMGLSKRTAFRKLDDALSMELINKTTKGKFQKV